MASNNNYHLRNTYHNNIITFGYKQSSFPIWCLIIKRTIFLLRKGRSTVFGTSRLGTDSHASQLWASYLGPLPQPCRATRSLEVGSTSPLRSLRRTDQNPGHCMCARDSGSSLGPEASVPGAGPCFPCPYSPSGPPLPLPLKKKERKKEFYLFCL